MKDLTNVQNKEIKEAILKIHKGCHNKTKVKLYKKLMGARLRWAKDLNISAEEMQEMIIDKLGSNCKYCNDKITAKNISLDHETPLDRGGISSKENTDIICSKCNRRKDSLTKEEYIKLVKFLREEFCEEARDKVLKQMSMKTYYGS
ncbi:MAG: HNH endonuclease [Elusimicrobiota bacterium]